MQANINHIRYLFQHKINIHPLHNKENCEFLSLLFDLNEEDIDQLYLFSCDISNHVLETIPEKSTNR